MQPNLGSCLSAVCIASHRRKPPFASCLVPDHPIPPSLPGLFFLIYFFFPFLDNLIPGTQTRACSRLPVPRLRFSNPSPITRSGGNTIHHFPVLSPYRTILFCSVLYCALLYCTAPHCIHYTHYTTLHYTTLHSQHSLH